MYEADYLGQQEAGRLAEWDGRTWTVPEKKLFVEVAGKSLSVGVHWVRVTVNKDCKATAYFIYT